MSLEIVRLDCFDEQVNYLKSFYQRIESDLKEFFVDFDPKYSDVNLGNGLYKDRIGNKSIPSGKRGGFRIITFTTEYKAFPIMIYSKREKTNATVDEINDKLEETVSEIERKNLL